MNQPHQPPSAEAWQAFIARSEGILDGTVSAVVPFGAFVQFDEGVDGLLPDVDSTRGLNAGDHVTVRVLALDPDNKRVSLERV